MTAATVPGPQPATRAAAHDDTGGQPATQPAAACTRPGPPKPSGRPVMGARPGPPKPSGRAVLVGLASVVINFGVPLLAYRLIHPHTSSALALALSGAIPVLYTLVILAVRRRLSALGVVSVVGFAIGALVSWATGGNALAQDLQDPVLTGLSGMACLVSIAVGQPLHQLILRWMGRSNPRYNEVADRAAASGTSLVSTAIIGVAFLGHAVAVAILALTQTTSTFLALQQPVGLPFFGLGIGGLFIYGHWQQSRQRAAASASKSCPGSDRPGSGQPDSDRPISGRPISGRPISGRPVSGQPVSGQHSDG